MIVTKPPLGWNSWNTFASNIDEKLIREAADAMVETGLRDAGYEYVVIDDCWSEKRRDAAGRLVADAEKFPNGMKAVADYVHSKGLKFGMYSCAGVLTCAGYPGSYEHEFDDAETFASWDVDFLKYDFCYHTPVVHGKYLYRRMGTALANCGRDILFSACSWGACETNEWIKSTGAHMWRSTGDIVDSWDSVKKLIMKQNALLTTNGQGCFNDMDMLIVGMNGRGHVGVSGCTFEEYRTHFSAWAILGSPLMIGCDIRSMSDETKKILMNRDVLAIDNDAAYRQVYNLGSEEKPVYVRALEGGDLAIGMFNLSDSRSNMNLQLDMFALPRSTGRTLELRDLWSGEVINMYNEVHVAGIEPHDCRLFRARVVRV